MHLVYFRLQQLKTVCLIFLCKILVFFSTRKHWVLFERGTDARDNGYHFYKYLKKTHPEQKVYYIIDKQSSDFKKVKDDAVHLGSIKNYWAIATAQKVISSHYGTGIPFIGKRVFDLCGLYKNYYFLQHGVIKDSLKGLFKENAPMNLFICGAKPEYDFILKTFGHSERVVQYTGLARFDNLHDINVKKQILVMPTWRSYIRSDDEFKQSAYFAAWQQIISDRKLIEKLEDTDTKLIFYVHYEMQKYLHYFTTTSKNVVLAKFKDYDVQTLLKESAVLVTDYSSVFFDFAYMKKPVLYFQFDPNAFYGGHYDKGYFDYYEMGFGPVCQKADEVVDSLLASLANDFKLEPLYEQRTNNFFPLHDQKNCERIYKAIIER